MSIACLPSLRERISMLGCELVEEQPAADPGRGEPSRSWGPLSLRSEVCAANPDVADVPQAENSLGQSDVVVAITTVTKGQVARRA